MGEGVGGGNENEQLHYRKLGILIKAARRRQVTRRMEEQMKEERKAQWMASLQGPGWARRGRCHGL